MKILIINQNAGNKGDRAVLRFMLDELIHNGVRDITVSTNSPRLWKNYEALYEGVVTFIPRGWDTDLHANIYEKILRRVRWRIWVSFIYGVVRRALVKEHLPWYVRLLFRICIKELWRALKQADYVLTTGGHRLTTILTQDVVCPQTFDMSAAVLLGKPLVLWSQSIGPFDFTNEESRAQIVKIIDSATRVYVRDETSVSEVAGLGASTESLIETADSVFGLRDMAVSQPAKPPSERDPVMGVSVYAPRVRDLAKYEHEVRSYSMLLNHAIESGYSVRFFPMAVGDGRERQYIKDVMQGVKNKDACSIVEGDVETPEHLQLVNECRLFVGHKTHSVVFALMAGVPLIAIAYHKKTEDFMEQFGLGEYCVPEAEVTGEKLVALFENLNRHLDDVSRKEIDMADERDRRVRKDLADLVDYMRKHTGAGE